MNPPTWFSIWFAVALAVPGVIVGAAFADMAAPALAGRARSLNNALGIARQATPWRIRLSRRVRLTDDNQKAVFILLVVGIVVAVARYSEYVGEIADALVVISGLVFGATMLAFTVFWLKKCVDGPSVVWRILLSSVLWTIGLFNAYWLQNAPFHGDAVGRFRARVAAQGAFGAFLNAPAGEFQQVMNQMVGASLCLLMLVVFVALCVASVAGIYIASHGRPRWFWLGLFWINKWAVSGWVWALAVVAGAGALALTSGIAFDGGASFSHWVSTVVPSVPATSPTP